MNRLRFGVAGVLGLATVAVLAGCGGTAAPSAEGAGPTAGAPGSAGASTGTGVAGGGSGAFDVCQVVTQADVAPFFTGPITAEEDTSQSGEFSQCIYQVTPHDGLAPMEIYVVRGDQAQIAMGAFSGGNEGALPFTGVGDQAVRQPGQASFAVIKGSTFCSVQLGSGNNAHYAALPAADASGNLPNAGAEAYARRLVTLCDKIFAASGS